MAYAVAILLISALTTVGLLALWAATSTADWFWRTMGFLAAISPVLLIPAYEPFVAFAIKGAVVAGGVQLAKWLVRDNAAKATYDGRFSIKSLIYLMVLLAIGITVFLNVPELNSRAWLSVLLIGGIGAILSLLGYWIFCGTRPRIVARLIITLIFIAVGAVALVLFDYFLPSLGGLCSWPPLEHEIGFDLAMIFEGYEELNPVPVWAFVLPLVVLMTAIVVLMVRRARVQQTSMWQIATALIGLILLLPSVYVNLRLVMMPGLPEQQLAIPNAYEELLAAARLMSDDPTIDAIYYEPEKATDAEVESAVKLLEPAFGRATPVIGTNSRRLVNYGSADVPVNDYLKLRDLARGLCVKGEQLRREGNSDAAADWYVKAIQLGHDISYGGLAVDGIIGFGCAWTASEPLYALREDFSAETLRAISQQIERVENSLEPFDDFVHRDHIWAWYSLGWHGRLMQILLEVSNDDSWSMVFFERAYDNRQALLRLMRTELLINAWYKDHSKWPDSLEQLVPDYMAAVPIDPFSSDGKPLQYARTDDGYNLYSVGINEIDEQGLRGSAEDPTIADMRLDVTFAPDEDSLNESK